MHGSMSWKKGSVNAKEPSINKGIEVMLPRSRRVEEEPPSWFDSTFSLIKWSVRVRINIDRRNKNGN